MGARGRFRGATAIGEYGRSTLAILVAGFSGHRLLCGWKAQTNSGDGRVSADHLRSTIPGRWNVEPERRHPLLSSRPTVSRVRGGWWGRAARAVRPDAWRDRADLAAVFA